MRWIRLIGGWALVAVGVIILVALAVCTIADAQHPQQPDLPLNAVLFFGTIFGLCPIFLGWTLLRRKVQRGGSPSVSPMTGPVLPPADQVIASIPRMSIDVALRQQDLTQAQYWLFRKNVFVLFFYSGVLVALISFFFMPAPINVYAWDRLRPQHLLFPAAAIAMAFLPWSNARIAFYRAQTNGLLRFCCDVSESGLRIISADATAETPWSIHDSAWETSGAFLLFQRQIPRIALANADNLPVIIPKRCCASPAEVDSLRGILAAALGQRSRMRIV
jgi:hypothetical protein